MFSLFIGRLVVITCLVLSVNCFAQKAEKPLDVIVQPAAVRDLQNYIHALGSLRAFNSLSITSKISKTITAIYFEDGQLVKKGDLLVEMMNTEESALMDEARHTADEAKKQLERTQSLIKTGAVSPALLDQRTREYTTAKARYLALEARFKDSLITAPFSGTIGLRNLSVGNLISSGQTIAILNSDDKMKLDFTVPVNYIQELRLGLRVEARTQDVNRKLYQGSIVSIDNQVDEATRSVKVRALLDNAAHELSQGMLMSVTVAAHLRKAVVISEAALVPMGSNSFVYVLQQNSFESKNPSWVAKKQQVFLGGREKGIVEVVSGLNSGDKVVTHGLQKIHDGQVVTILAEQSNDPAKVIETLPELLKQKSSR